MRLREPARVIDLATVRACERARRASLVRMRALLLCCACVVAAYLVAHACGVLV